MEISIDSNNERFASISLDNCLIVWNINTGEKLHIFTNDLGDFVY